MLTCDCGSQPGDTTATHEPNCLHLQGTPEPDVSEHTPPEDYYL